MLEEIQRASNSCKMHEKQKLNMFEKYFGKHIRFYNFRIINKQ